jgi:hypothetical protein
MNNSFLTKNAVGYSTLLIFFGLLLVSYFSKDNLVAPLIIENIALAGASAIIAVTISIFFLWSEDRVKKLEDRLGPIGHVFHCGYCLSLWLAMIATGLLGLSLFGRLTYPIADFFLTWWAQGAANVLFFEVITILWFKKVQNEFVLRELYKGRKKD